MNKKIYLSIGIVLLLSSLLTSMSWFNLFSCEDGLCIISFAATASIILGVLYILFGLKKFERNHLSDISLKSTIIGLLISLIGIPLWIGIVLLANINTFAFLASILIFYLTCILVISASIVCIISIFKK